MVNHFCLFCLFGQKINLVACRIQTQIMGAESKDVDHETTTTAKFHLKILIFSGVHQVQSQKFIEE